MCYGHPHHHPCGHQSVKWHYCPRATIDASTGHATVCRKTTYAGSQPSKARCPLQNCYFKELGGVWDCCQCQNGPNTQGWCMFPLTQAVNAGWTETCGHGCCKNCTRSALSSESAGPMPEDTSAQKKKKPREGAGDNNAGAGPSASHAAASAGGYGYEEQGESSLSGALSAYGFSSGYGREPDADSSRQNVPEGRRKLPSLSFHRERRQEIVEQALRNP
ncbi:hypothetical protein SPI_02442 [Niveomyces insectorum RCEF 264]|uniref:Uncharacterized protein n=1 Tax=Niveomyces insectorum RCEF 264 TaxID=1081102 RepID=A0A167Y080_9HYPO|nr:hypothetical protein SPI_02442 [Niveomyces insectorum RCEF 264]